MTWHVDLANCPGPGTGTTADPFCTIEAGLAAAADGDVVCVADGTYTGPGNRDLSFEGRGITLRSKGGPAVCIIDIAASASDNHTAFALNSGETPASVVDGFTITGGNVIAGGAFHLYEASPTITNCVLTGNIGAQVGGALSGWQSSPVISHCVITNNESAWFGAGLYLDRGAAVIDGCLIANNLTYFDDGAGIYLFHTDGVVITNSLLAGNTAGGKGGGLYVYHCDPTIRGCTFAQNTASDDGGGILGDGWAHPLIESSILWANTAGSRDDQISIDSGGSATVSCSNIHGGWEGTGNIDVDPQFADEDGPDNDPNAVEDNDYRLAPGSPCRNTGAPAFTPQPGETDLDGHARLLCDVVDMGAYEAGIGDITCDELVDLADFAFWPSCRTSPASAGCTETCRPLDFDGDSDIDLLDAARFFAQLE